MKQTNKKKRWHKISYLILSFFCYEEKIYFAFVASYVPKNDILGLDFESFRGWLSDDSLVLSPIYKRIEKI